MTAKLSIGNLPAGTRVEEVEHELHEFGAPVVSVEPIEGGDPDDLAFLVTLDMEPHTLQLMLERRRDRYFKGRKIRMFMATLGD